MNFEESCQDEYRSDQIRFKEKGEIFEPLFVEYLSTIHESDPEKRLNLFIDELNKRYSFDEIAFLELEIGKFLEANPVEEPVGPFGPAPDLEIETTA
ncbi:MAG: hypothetical protein ABIU09_13400 [Pyrinomonadaceae bacterium]